MTVIVDEQLMQQLSRGDKAALGRLMSRWQGTIQGFIYRMCGRRDWTEDIHQEVWTRVYLYRRKYRPRGAFRSYLFAIAANTCRRFLSRQSRHPVLLTDPLDESIPVTSDDPPVLDTLIHQEQLASIQHALLELPVTQRITVLLYIHFDTDYDRIAAVLQCLPGTARSHMSLALKKLRRKLAPRATEENQVRHEG